MTTANHRRVRVHGSPWQGVADACASAAKQFNDPVAMEGVNAATTAYVAIEALGQALSQVGKHTVESVAIHPSVAAYLEELGKYVLAASEPTQQVGASVTRAHSEKINRVVESDRKERKWDISVHDGGGHTGQGRHRIGRRAV